MITVPTWAHPEWEDWQMTREGNLWHAAGMFHVDKDWQRTKNSARERRAFCGARLNGSISPNPDPDEPGLRCGNCLSALAEVNE